MIRRLEFSSLVSTTIFHCCVSSDVYGKPSVLISARITFTLKQYLRLNLLLAL
uniref:Uncharacterized protein n=1 Tax=Parascaris equorum TaxID=6256 RepID=A0A914RP94_PAREQ